MIRDKYMMAVGSGLAGSAINAVSTLGVMWLLNMILGKSGFGTIILALVVLQVITSIVASGFVSVLLYRVSRLTVTDIETARSMTGTILLYGVSLGAVTGGGIAIFAESIAALFGKPELTPWIFGLSIVVPLDVARQVLVESSRAQQRIQIAILLGEVIPALLRLLLLSIVFLLSLSDNYLMASYILTQLVPVVILLLLLRPIPSAVNQNLSRSDFNYGLKLALNRAANEPSRSIDILIVGALTSANVTADYALGSRIAKMLIVMKNAFGRLLVPRLAGGIASGDTLQIRIEYGLARLISFTTTLLGVMGICAIGPYVLPWFGEYQDAFPVIMILAAAMMVKVAVGASGGYLNMAGYAGYTLLSTVLGMTVNVVVAMLLIPLYAANGGALAVLLGAIIIQTMVGAVLWKLDRFAIIDLPSLIAMFCGVSLAVIAAFNSETNIFCAAGFACVGFGYVYAKRSSWRQLLSKTLTPPPSIS